MFSTAIIIFREALEIALILGVVLAATRGLPGRILWIAGGVAAGTAGAGLVAAFTEVISTAASGLGQELFNALILFAAALMIGSTALWVRTHAREMAMHMKRVGHDVTAGKLPHYTLSTIIALAILREGSEIVLFIYGMKLSGQSAASIAAGSGLGLILGTLTGILFYHGLLKLPAKAMLTFTSGLLILLVAGLTAQAAGYLSAAGYFNDLSRPLWDSSWLLSEDGILGKALHSLIGYTARPSEVQLLFYGVTLTGLLALTVLMDKRKKHAAIALAFLSCLIYSDPALALDKIYSPYVTRGETELEYSGSNSFDGHHEKDNLQSHELELEYGVTDHWRTGISGTFEKTTDQSLKLNATEWENTVEFFEPGEYWLDTALLVSYAQAASKGDPNGIEVKLLLEKDIGKFIHLANIGIEQEAGPHAAGGPDRVLLWNSRYKLSHYFEPGVEIQSDFGKTNEGMRWGDQEHYVGPAAYGQIIPHLKYEAAYLFGISNAASQSSARLLLEYEAQF